MDVPYKDSEKQKAAQRKHYLDNKCFYQERNRRNQKTKQKVESDRRARIYDYINAIKANPCVDCGGKFHPAAMDFDHCGVKKLGGVARLVVSASFDRIKAEIDKCELVCANCHRVRTYNENSQPAC